MKSRLVLFLKYYIFWICYFVFLKILFLIYYTGKASKLSISEICGVFLHGFRLDLSTATYIVSAFTLVLILFSFFSNKVLHIAYKIMTLFTLTLTTFIVIADLELYGFWGFRLDTTPLLYINTPGEMVASIEWYVILKQLFIGASLVFLFYWIYRKTIEKAIEKVDKVKWWNIPILLFLMATLIIPIRGGLGLAPLNTGSAYFCQNQFANHAANNAVWNLGFSFTYYTESTKNPFAWTDIKSAVSTRDSLYAEKGETKNILKTSKPNIIIIVLESFNNKMIEPLGGMAGVTPNMNKLFKEAVYFNNIYCNGDRSDKGLVAIHSGFPAQPIASIIKFPRKTESLPFITKDLKKKNYHCSYYYGGDIDFAAMRSYMQNAGYDELISDENFPKSTYGAKWGVHDEFIFKRLYDDISKAKSPFFKAIFSLSSHEPFDVPFHSKFKGTTEEQKFLNAAYYTDSCVGDFIQKLKKLPSWDSTLVVITADHGSAHPYNPEYYSCIRFKIPLLMLGGAVAIKDSAVNRIGSQSDISITLLNQLKIMPEKQFPYSKDLLDDSSNSFAHYTFNSGFGYVTEKFKIVYDNHSNKLIYKEGEVTEKDIETGRSYQEVVYDDFLKR